MRYIDADKLVEMCKRQIECEWNTIAAPNSWADAFQDFSDLVEQTPTEDVVSRSEVEDLIYKFECLLYHSTGGKLSKHTYDLLVMEAVVTDYIQESYEEGYEDGKSNVAGEIIDDLAREGLLNVEPWGIANLKKKYTEK